VNSYLSRAAVLCLLLGCTAIFLANARRAEVPQQRALLEGVPLAFDSWQGTVAPPMEPAILKVLGVDDYISRVYYRPDQSGVGLYVGYYGSQRQGDTIHSPLNCLPGSGWEAVSEGRLTIANADGAGRDITVNRYIVRKGLDRQLVLYWYQSRGRVVASEYWSKFYLVNDAIRTNRTDGALVRVVAPIAGGARENDAAAQQLAEQFVRVLFPLLPAYLPN
jgi:EpsI family protein